MVRLSAAFLLLALLPTNGLLLPPSVTGASTRPWLLLLSSKSDNDEGFPPRKTLQQEWKEKQNKILRNMESLEEAGLQYSKEREEALKNQLRDSIEDMRKKLLESTPDKDVRLLVNQNFIETRQQIKQDLCQARDRVADKLRQRKEKITETLTELDTVLTPAFMTYESFEEIMAKMEKAIPGSGDVFKNVNDLAECDILEAAATILQKKEVQQAMDQFQADMEDRLEDLSDDIHFQIRIAEEAKE